MRYIAGFDELTTSPLDRVGGGEDNSYSSMIGKEGLVISRAFVLFPFPLLASFYRSRSGFRWTIDLSPSELTQSFYFFILVQAIVVYTIS